MSAVQDKKPPEAPNWYRMIYAALAGVGALGGGKLASDPGWFSEHPLLSCAVVSGCAVALFVLYVDRQAIQASARYEAQLDEVRGHLRRALNSNANLQTRLEAVTLIVLRAAVWLADKGYRPDTEFDQLIDQIRAPPTRESE